MVCVECVLGHFSMQMALQVGFFLNSRVDFKWGHFKWGVGSALQVGLNQGVAIYDR